MRPSVRRAIAQAKSTVGKRRNYLFNDISDTTNERVGSRESLQAGSSDSRNGDNIAECVIAFKA